MKQAEQKKNKEGSKKGTMIYERKRSCTPRLDLKQRAPRNLIHCLHLLIKMPHSKTNMYWSRTSQKVQEEPTNPQVKGFYILNSQSKMRENNKTMHQTTNKRMLNFPYLEISLKLLKYRSYLLQC